MTGQVARLGPRVLRKGDASLSFALGVRVEWEGVMIDLSSLS